MKLSRTILFLISLATLSGVAVFSILTAHSPVAASSTFGGGNVQGYSAGSPIGNGYIVQLDEGSSNRVKVAQQSSPQGMFGVVVDRNHVPFTISNSGTENEVFVAVSGTYNVLVSTQAGPIESGDYLTLSSVNGMAMKAGTEGVTVFGRANEPFDGKGIVLGKATLKETNGEANETVSIGSVPVTIDIRSNPNEKSTKADVPEFLERIGQAIAEKEVSAIRIYISLAITAVSIISAIALLYSGVRNSIISIGRNPMAKKSIFRALLEIILTSVLILIIGLFAVYLLLRL